MRELDVPRLLSVYDVAFDVPLRHREALGLLQLARAVPRRGRDRRAELTACVGEAWCDVIRADVELDLRHGLAVADASRDDAERLRRTVSTDGNADDSTDELAAYVAARWYDGTGKVLYRVGSHARARMSFETADELATGHGLWWCLPDLRSNRFRASWEEARQVGRVATVVGAMERELTDRTAEAAARGISLSVRPDPTRDQEFLRGCSSLLHNLAVATVADDPARSLELSRRAEAVSRALRDPYRRAQALLHQALLAERHHGATDLSPDDAVRLYRQVGRLRWVRGQRIAQQNLARLRGDAAGARVLAGLIDDIAAENAAAGGSAGLDTDFRRYTVEAYVAIAERLVADDPTPQARRRLDEARERTLLLARSVRRVIALPAYKRAYSSTVRPVFLRRLERDLAAPAQDVPKTHWEDTLTLVEESSSRELLDMMAASALPELGPPEDPGTAADPPSTAAPAPLRHGARRSGLRSVPATDLDADRAALLAREQEFEEQFLRRPLDAVPHDEEIARTAERFTVNNPGTCIVRYFGHGYDLRSRQPTDVSAFVISDTVARPVHCTRYGEVRALVDDLQASVVPTEEQSRRIWELLLEPVWPDVVAGGRAIDHLVIVPSDDLFSVPFHIAARDGYDEGSYPLGALVPLSQSVSLCAFLSRGRHLLRRQRVEESDDLAALVVRDARISADELVHAGWPAEHVVVAGDPPAGLSPAVHHEEADWSGLAAAVATRPEFFVYAGHGRYHPSYGELGPFLDMRTAGGRPDRLTPFDVALRLRLARNRLTVLGACLAGQGAQTAGGDVVGFLRAFIAAGSGAIALPLWEVLDECMATTAGMLLRASRLAAAGDGTFDVVRTLHEHYRRAVEDSDHAYWIDRLPLVVYT